MKNKTELIKQIVYRSTHRGTKEMDMLLGSFVKKYIKSFKLDELLCLSDLLKYEDEILYQWYFNKRNLKKIPENKVSKKLKKFKL